MSTLCYFKDKTEAKREKDYYYAYDFLLKSIDSVSQTDLAEPICAPVNLDIMNDIAVEITGLIGYRLDNFEKRKSFSINVTEILFEMLDGDLAGGELISRAIYVAATEVRSLIQHYKDEGKAYYDKWYINHRGHICIEIAKPAKGWDLDMAPMLYIAEIAQTNRQAFRSHLIAALEDYIDFKDLALVPRYDHIALAPLLKEFREHFSTEIIASHGMALIVYFRMLQIILSEQKNNLKIQYDTQLHVECKITKDWHHHLDVFVMLISGEKLDGGCHRRKMSLLQ